jgi:hypothetical protein
VLKQLAVELPRDPANWLAELEADVLAYLAKVDDASTAELGDAVPGLQTLVDNGSGKWTRRAPISSRVLVTLAMDGHIVRGRPAGTWCSSQYRWALSTSWFSGPKKDTAALDAEHDLLRAYVDAFGPVTFTDMRWWTGWTVAKLKRTIASLSLQRVSLDRGEEGFVLEVDSPTDSQIGCASLLPGLDSTSMGWKERDWYLGDHGPALFDRNGNAGPSVWWRGRMVGAWAQRPDGQVVTGLLDDVGAEAERAIRERADELARWLEGVVVAPRFRTPLERSLSTR